MSGFREISTRLESWNGSIGGFVRDLDRRGKQYLSFSKLNSLEFCPYRYFLEYVKGWKLRPEPDYFIKGRAFHEVVARMYRKLSKKNEIDEDELQRFLERKWSGDSIHLGNAVKLAVENAHKGWEVVGVEQQFVLSLGSKLPPCIGVIDLLLRRGRSFLVVDHKSGKNFNEPDETQLLIYREYVRRRYKPKECLTIYDEYRWVSNLLRVRKPAFRRTEVSHKKNAWAKALKRLTDSHRDMQGIRKVKNAPATGPCYMCPFKERCPNASTGNFGW